MDQPLSVPSAVETELLKEVASLKVRMQAAEMTIEELAKLGLFLWKTIGGEVQRVEQEAIDSHQRREKRLDN